MGRRGGIQRRRVIFIGVEGKSDRAFVNFLARVCDDAGLHLHLDVKPATGGDSVAVGFGSIDLRRAARHDNELRKLLGMLGL